MRIIHIIPSLSKGGAERLVLDICNELNLINTNEVCLITFSDINEYSEHSKHINHKVIPSTFIPSISSKNVIDIKELQNFISDFKPDIIHTHLWEAEMVLSQIDFPKAKWFSHFHDNMKQLRKTAIPKSKIDITDLLEKKIIIKNYKKKNSNFICISNHTYNYAKKILPCELNKNTTLLFNAINTSDFKPNKNILLDKIRLINIGSFVSKKNQKLAIDTLIYLNSINIESDMFLLGDGPLKKELIEYTKMNNIQHLVHFTGNINNVHEYLQKSNFYLHTANYEPLGLVLIEAMSVGLPVICTNGGGNADLMKNGLNGYMLPRDATPKELGDKVVKIFNDKKEYRKTSEFCKLFAQNFDIKEYCIKLVNIYKEAISSANSV